MQKVCLIEQSCGLGDILLAIKIGCHYASQDYRVVWPVEKIYANISHSITTRNKIHFPCVDEPFQCEKDYSDLIKKNTCEVHEYKGGLYIPLRRSFHSSAGQHLRSQAGHDASNMLSKFTMCGLEYHNWQDYFSIQRNFEKEVRLKNQLNIKSDDRIHLVNSRFGTPPRWNENLTVPIATPLHLKRVDLQIISGYDLFDWAGIMEQAIKIDTVATSIVYLFEKLNLNCIPVIYTRNKNRNPSKSEDIDLMKTIYSKKYIYV